MAKNYSEAHHKAINKYRNKTYKTYNLVLRNEEDSDLIQAIEAAKSNKVTIRQWLRSVYESGYTEEQLIEAFGNFKGVMTPETVKRILAKIERLAESLSLVFFDDNFAKLVQDVLFPKVHRPFRPAIFEG